MQNIGYDVLNRSKTLKSCVVGVCPINTLTKRATVITGQTQTLLKGLRGCRSRDGLPMYCSCSAFTEWATGCSANRKCFKPFHVKPISAGRNGSTKPVSRNPIKCTMLFPSRLHTGEGSDLHFNPPQACTRMYGSVKGDHPDRGSSILVPDARVKRSRFNHAMWYTASLLWIEFQGKSHSEKKNHLRLLRLFTFF